MTPQEPRFPVHLDEDAALRAILEGTATETGERFFAALVKNLAQALNTHGAWVTEYLEESRTLRALAFWLNGQWIHGYETRIDGTPCEEVVEQARLIHYPDKIFEIYPNEPDIQKTGAVSYMGVPLQDTRGKILGHLAVLDTKPLPKEPRGEALFRIFAARASAELQRLRAEADLREREAKLGRLVDSAMDAILELDEGLTVRRINPAAEKVFRCPSDKMVGQDFRRVLSDDGETKLLRLIRQLDTLPEGSRYLWIPGGLTARCPDGEAFQAEATLSCFELHNRPFYTLILRNVNDRLEAEQRIESLRVETEYLREELKYLREGDDLIGDSPPMRRVKRDIEQVADTDAAVLILGETGTGKELIARAVHAASRRRNKPMVTLNCGAIPSTLIESEFFGHEKGAFTGATQKRDGRFTLADGGTIFLDEVGELPLDMQVKLLRVLQEGEFEPVGSSRTKKVDVRVIAATNRDLHQAVQEGKFRADLYYRLNVFPLSVPPLRERCEDIPLLAAAFVRRFSQRLGRPVLRLRADAVDRLTSYDWPGNVRELQNVIERAVITSSGAMLNLDRALPATEPRVRSVPESPMTSNEDRIRTAQELEELYRQNLLRALEACKWRVSGHNGAARKLGMNPSTLTSRIKALGIKRPK